MWGSRVLRIIVGLTSTGLPRTAPDGEKNSSPNGEELHGFWVLGLRLQGCPKHHLPKPQDTNSASP